MDNKIVKDIMVPIEEYAVVHESDTLKEALSAHRQTHQNLAAGHHVHRAVLIKDVKENIIGKLGHHGFLAALDPKFNFLADIKSTAYGSFDLGALQEEMDELGFWEDNLQKIVTRSKEIKVGDVMKKIHGQRIEADSSLTEAIHLLIKNDVLSLLVENNKQVIGVVRLSDLFQEISEFILAE